MTVLGMVLRAAGGMAALFLAAVPFHAAPARANVIFDFSGVCDDGCSGTASGVLTLADSYRFGTRITSADFISMQYSSSSGGFDLTSANSPMIGGGLNADGSFNSTGLLNITAFPAFFEAIPGAFLTNLGDFGATFTFTLVSAAAPEPSTWAMILLGFAGLGYAGYRKAKRTRIATA